MADPLSISASIVSLADVALRIPLQIKASLGKKEKIFDAIADAEISAMLLKEISESAMALKGELPNSALSCIQTCHWRQENLDALLKDKPSQQKLEPALRGLRDSTMLLRDIVTDSLTQTMLREQRESQLEMQIRQLESLDQARMEQIEMRRFLEHHFSGKSQDNPSENAARVFNGVIHMNVDDESSISHDNVREIANTIVQSILPQGYDVNNGEVHVNFGGTGSGSRGMDRQRNEDIDRIRQQLAALSRGAGNYDYPVHIVGPMQEEDHYFAIAKIDIQSTDNWVSLDLAKRLNLAEHIVESEPNWYQGFGGRTFQASGSLKLTWYATNTSKTRENAFLINSQPVQFDLVLGKKWIFEEGMSAFEDPVLALADLKFTDDEHKELQANLIERHASEKELVPARRAQGASRREQLRKLKSTNASRAASALQSSAPSRSGSSMPTRRTSFSTNLSAGLPSLLPVQPEISRGSKDQALTSSGANTPVAQENRPVADL